MFQDEARFGRINATHRCWAPSGMRPEIGYQIIREYTYVYAAVSPFDGVMDSLVLPETSAYAMSLFLEEVSSRHSEDYIVMIMDKAAWHTAHILNIPENIAIPIPIHIPIKWPSGYFLPFSSVILFPQYIFLFSAS